MSLQDLPQSHKVTRTEAIQKATKWKVLFLKVQTWERHHFSTSLMDISFKNSLRIRCLHLEDADMMLGCVNNPGGSCMFWLQFANMHEQVFRLAFVAVCVCVPWCRNSLTLNDGSFFCVFLSSVMKQTLMFVCFHWTFSDLWIVMYIFVWLNWTLVCAGSSADG